MFIEMRMVEPILLKLNLAQHLRESKDWPERSEALSAATQVIESILRKLDYHNEEAVKALRSEFLQLRDRLGL